jgi:cellulose biosynthesis protein BcsQ
MPTIVFASPKGGVGKSTAAVLLATELASHGGSVTMIDPGAFTIAAGLDDKFSGLHGRAERYLQQFL